MTVDKDLAALAQAHGVAIEYWDQTKVHHVVEGAVVREVLSALGVDAATPESCRRELKELSDAKWQRMVPPIVVVRQQADTNSDPWDTWVHAVHDASVRVWVDLEDGTRRFDVVRIRERGTHGEIHGQRISEFVYRLPHDLPLGWHRLVAETSGEQGSCPLVVAPTRLNLPASIDRRRGWGIATQLYSVRSRKSWGIGDLADLADMASFFGRDLGADYVLVNPLHAGSPTPPMEPSPYLPVSRRFANPLYIRVEEIPEFAYLEPTDRERIEAIRKPLYEADLTSDLIDRDTSWAAKRLALELVYQVPLTQGRKSEFRDYLAQQDQGLTDFATWCALAEEYGRKWNEWPLALQDPRSPAVAEESIRLAYRIEFHRWLQWVLDGQMASAQNAARESGMSLGVMHDLAVGVHQFGAESWSEADVMARGVTVGAPPDAFNQVGQDWSQPPRRPDKLAEAGYAPYRDMLRTLLRHSGGLRIDHVLGLFRLWWIPEGLPPGSGTYVRYDHQAMVDILVLEAHRAGAVVVGEDLGTVEPWVQDFLAERGILGTSILWFERNDDGPLPVNTWRENTMASVTVHDLPPTAGYIAGDHVKLRHELGLLTTSVEEEEAHHQLEIAQWRELLESSGLMRPGSSEAEMVIALHRLLTRTPAKLLNVSLADLVGERRTQNQPGTNKEYPNWRIPLCGPDGKPVLLEDFPQLPNVLLLLQALGGSAGVSRAVK